MFQNLTSKLNGGNIPLSSSSTSSAVPPPPQPLRDPMHSTNNSNSTYSTNFNRTLSTHSNPGNTNTGSSSNSNSSYKNLRHSNASIANETSGGSGSGTSASLTSGRVSRTPEPNGEPPRPTFRSGSGLLRSYSSPSTGLVLPSGSGTGAGRGSGEGQKKRRLPGPAGNLPRLSAEEKDRLFRSKGKPFGGDLTPNPNSTSPNSSIKKKMKSVLHGPVDAMFATGAWQDMMRELGTPDYKPSSLHACKLLSEWTALSISDIEQNRELHRGKIEKIVVMIKDVSLSEIDTAVTLLDPSGEMPGTLHRDVLEQYKNNEIRAGTVLALTNVSVFSLQVSHYLMILPRNIVGLFQPHPVTISLSQGSSQERGSSQKRSRVLSPLELASQIGSPAGVHVNMGASPSQDFNSSPSLRHSSIPPTTTSTIASTTTTTSNTITRKRPILSPDWSDIPEDDDLSQLKTPGSPSQATLDLMNLSMDSQQPPSVEYDDLVSVKSERAVITLSSSSQPGEFSTRRSQENVLKKQRVGSLGFTPSPILSQEASQPVTQDQGVQFQSLRQTLGNGGLAHGRPTILQDEWPLTPMGLLGSATPTMPQPTQRLAGGGGSLAAFAASADLRKRSSPTTLNTRANSSGSATIRSPVMAGAGSVGAAAAAVVASSNSLSTPNGISQGHNINNNSSGSSSQQQIDQQLSSTDWLDEFSGVDFEGALDDELLSSPPSTRVVRDSTTIIASTPPSINVLSSQEPHRPSTTSNPSSGPAASTASRPPQQQPQQQQQQAHDPIDDDDDLDNLLDGLDESELYDL
ncbi:hypothetical protein BGZ83_004561 [Gryganskiella cystojenkinii]|nr:hypothetical protein BGZ83_004561 [Gryganskiella cystojenkinii]